jgi:hypothetical protein
MPRMTGSMAPPPAVQARAATPPVGSGVMAPPPAPPPPAPAPPPFASLPSTMPPPSRGEVQVGPNAVLRGAIAPPHAHTGQQSSLAEELKVERQKRGDAERALEEANREAALLKRKLDQLQADLKRMRGGQAPTGDDTRDDGELQLLRGRVGELEGQLQRARASAGSAPIATSPRASSDPAAADATIALGDSLAELRASLRAANDEAGLLTAPAESVQVVGESLRSAAEQLETARGHLRALGKLLGVS